MSLEDEWALLDNNERNFCKETSISAKDFYNVKHLLIQEQAKNMAISHKVLKERGRNLCDIKQHADVIFDFIVKDNTNYKEWWNHS